MDICWERADLLAFRLCDVLIVGVPFPYGVCLGKDGNSIVSVSFVGHCLFMYF